MVTNYQHGSPVEEISENFGLPVEQLLAVSRVRRSQRSDNAPQLVKLQFPAGFARLRMALDELFFLAAPDMYDDLEVQRVLWPPVCVVDLPRSDPKPA